MTDLAEGGAKAIVQKHKLWTSISPDPIDWQSWNLAHVTGNKSATRTYAFRLIDVPHIKQGTMYEGK